MILSIPSALLILILTYVYGLIPFILLKRSLPQNPITPFFVGFALLGILSGYFLLSGAINFFVLMLVMIVAIIACWRYQNYYQSYTKYLVKWITSLSVGYKTLLIVMLMLLLYQGALPAKIHDMAAYYLQTLQWMQQVGVVKGLGNLYPALGLGSAWHSLLSIFQIPLLPAFYGINGVLIFTLFTWLLFEYVANEQASTLQNVFIGAYGLGLFPISFLYLTAPSPDLPLLVFTPLLLYYTLIDTKSIPSQIMLLMACFLFAIKPPALLGIIIGIAIIIQTLKKKQTEPNTYPYGFKTIATHICIAIFCLTPIITKNIIQTGYVLYPLGDIGFEEQVWKSMYEIDEKTSPAPAWKIPTDWNNAYRKGIVVWGYTDSIPAKVFKESLPATSNRFISWVSRPGYKGFMNTLLLLNFLLACLLCFFAKPKRNKRYYVILIGLSTIEWFYLTQYRLMLPLALSLFSLNLFTITSLWPTLASNHTSLNWKPLYIYLVLILFLFLSFVPISAFRDQSRNKHITKTEGFQSAYLINPYSNYAEGTLDSTQINIGFIYYFKDKNYTWNAPIPAVSASHSKFIENHFAYQLQRFGPRLKDGFYLKKITP